MIRRFAAMTILGAAILALSSGCGDSSSKVEVKITLDGAPLPGASVIFTPTSETNSATYTGFTDANGVAKIVAQNQKDGVPVGAYKVTVVKTDEAKSTGDPGKDMKDFASGMPGIKPGGGGKPGGPGPGPGPGAAGQGPKTNLPVKYGDPKLTPFTYTVPDDVKGVKEFAIVGGK